MKTTSKKTDLDTWLHLMSQTYAVIPTHELGKQAISFWIENYPETLHPRFNKKFITNGIELILN